MTVSRGKERMRSNQGVAVSKAELRKDLGGVMST